MARELTTQEFKDLCLPYSKEFYYHAYRLLGSEQDAEDAVQDLYEKLYRLGTKLLELNSIKAYGLKVIRNICLDRLKSPSNRKSGLEMVAQLSTEDLEQRMDSSEELRQLVGVIERLPEVQRRLIELHFFRELHPKEIAQITGLSQINIRVQISRARKRIKELYREL